MNLDYLAAVKILNESTVLYTEDVINNRIKELAVQIEADINTVVKSEVPIFLSVMNGGMFFAAQLLKYISLPILANYIHVSRYHSETVGASHVVWYRQFKNEDIIGRDVYIVDDILDEGHTLIEITRAVISAGAKSCKVIVLIDKDLGKVKPIKADYVGLDAPHKFLFGCGMDIFGLYRQLPYICIYNG